MQYMLLIYANEEAWAQMPESRRGPVMQEFGTYIESIVKSGHFRAGARLHPASMGATVRLKDGRPATTDGPFAEAREQLGGYFLVECRNLDEALGIAAGIPSVRFGDAVEVRPVLSQR